LDICCTRPGCPKPINSFPDLDNAAVLKNVPQKYCMACGMPLILDGRYVPIRKLGQGGFGAAFLSCDRRTPAMRECVVKQLQPSVNFKPEQIKKVTQLFHREASVLEQLGAHPQIPELFAFFALEPSSFPSTMQQPQELFYLAQQYIDGENLEQELCRKGKFSEAEVIEVLLGVLPILDFVHNNNSIHRDIKPSNTMRARDGQLYLVDFGAVKQVVATGTKQPGNSPTLDVPSVSITNVYTPGFAPPEQTDGRAIFPSSDLYALAASCLFLLTGKQPTYFIDVYTNTWNWRRQVNISDKLANILERMLKEKPIERFQSAKEALDALKRKTPNHQDFSSFEWLTAPFLTGFEVGLLAVFMNNLFREIGLGLVAIILGGLVYAQYRHIILKKHLFIIVGATFALVLLSLSVSQAVPILGFNLANNHLLVAFFAFLCGVLSIVLIGLFQLIYQLLAFIH
jgi:serine/threonine protein kinase